MLHYNLELIHNTGKINVLQCVFLLMEHIVGFINYYFYMPKNIRLDMFDHAPNLCLWLDYVGCGAVTVTVV
jgi:hypothetical protein